MENKIRKNIKKTIISFSGCKNDKTDTGRNGSVRGCKGKQDKEDSSKNYKEMSYKF